MHALFRLVIAALAVIAMAVSTLLIVVCISRAGAVFGMGGLLLGTAFLLGSLAGTQGSRRLWGAAAFAFAGWMAATGWLAVHAPDGHPPAGAPVQSRYLGGRDGFRRFAFGNLLPEGDQFALGFRLVPLVDRLFTWRQAQKLSGLTGSIYRELEANPAFRALGSAMPEAYDELWRQPFNHGHYYLYVPPGLDRSAPHPALVFLHGSGGNFKAYTWVLAEVANRLDMVLIAPSYGLGDWHEPDTTQLVQAVLEDARQIIPLDLNQVHLMGLSNGGLGVSQAGRALGGKLRSLTFLSPVLDLGCVTSREFAEQWRDRPVLVISGREDDRIPFDYVTNGVGMMQRNGAKVNFQPVDGADHFMVFSHRALVVGSIIDWLQPQLGS